MHTYLFYLMHAPSTVLQVIRSLKHAMQPAVTGAKVHFSLPFGYTAKVVPEQVPPIFFGERTIVYGILQKNMLAKVVSGSKGTVTLEGELLGEKMKHALEFEVPGEGAGQPQLVPTIHHLAGKALIKGLQNEESVGAKKAEIVKLSCECSVISKHTAFIAIDEDQKEPVKGSLQTWDVVAPPPQAFKLKAKRSSALRVASGGARGGGGSVGMECLSRKKTANSVSSSSAMERRMVSRAGRNSPEMEFDAIALNRCFKDEGVSEGMPPPCPSRFGAGPPPPPPGSGWNVMPSSGLPPPPAPSAPSSSLAAQPKPSSTSQPALPRIISLQLASGAWKLSAELAALLGHSMEELKTACPAACEGEMELVWATVLVLSYLEKKLLELKDEWELIAMKAHNWLKKQHIPEGHTKDSFLEKAKTVA